MHIVTVGDVMLDVLVDAPGGLLADDDTEASISVAAGGQAANVAAWAASLGARASVVGPVGTSAAGQLLGDHLKGLGVEVMAIEVPTVATVVSILSGEMRTLASDAGDQRWVDRLDAAVIPDGVDWLHVSAYPLLRASDPSRLLAFVDDVRRRGVSVSLDLSSAGLIAAYGAAKFVDVVTRLQPRLVFATAAEWNALAPGQRRVGFDVVIKRGASGVTTLLDGVSYDHVAPVVEVVDLTGAGDALAAGYLVGGIDLALITAARCVTQRGAQPSVIGP